MLKPFREAEIRARLSTHHRVATLTKALQAKNEELKRTIERLKQEFENGEKAEVSLEASQQRVEWLSDQEIECWDLHSFVASSQAIGRVVDWIRKLQSLATSVLISGESGTGKELVAKAIHAGSPRHAKVLFPLNCSAIPGDMADPNCMVMSAAPYRCVVGTRRRLRVCGWRHPVSRRDRRNATGRAAQTLAGA